MTAMMTRTWALRSKRPTAAAGQSISIFDSATSVGSTITAPSGVLAGDVLILADRASNSSGLPTTVVPTGFTSISEVSSTPHKQILSYKLATGSEGGSSITGMNGSRGNAKCLYVVRGTSAIASVVVSTPGAEMTDGNPSSQNVAASGQTPPLIVIGCYCSYGPVAPRTMSPAKDGEINSNNAFADLWLAYKIYNTSPGNVSVDMDDEDVFNALQSCYLRFT